MLRLPQLPRTIEAAKRDLGARSADVRRSAAADLARHREAHPEEVERSLVSALEDDNAGVRAAAARGLAEGFAEEGRAALERALDDGSEEVVEAALIAIGEAGKPSSVPPVEALLADRRPRVRYQALIAFSRLAPRDDVVRALLQATGDADAFVAHVAFRLAEETADREEVDLDPRIVARAVATLDDERPRVRAVAAVVAASAGDERADKVLVSVIAGRVKPVESEDLAAAIDLAGERRLERAVPALEKRAFTGVFGIGADEFAWHARVALASMKHPRAIAEIMKDLRSSSFDKRTLAVAAAGRARVVEARDAIAAMRDQPRRAHPSAVAGALDAFDGTSAGEPLSQPETNEEKNEP